MKWKQFFFLVIFSVTFSLWKPKTCCQQEKQASFIVLSDLRVWWQTRFGFLPAKVLIVIPVTGAAVASHSVFDVSIMCLCFKATRSHDRAEAGLFLIETKYLHRFIFFFMWVFFSSPFVPAVQEELCSSHQREQLFLKDDTDFASHVKIGLSKTLVIKRAAESIFTMICEHLKAYIYVKYYEDNI